MEPSSQKHYRLPPNSSGPAGLFGRIVAFIAGIGALVVSLFVGAIFIAGLLGFMLIVGAVVATRVWWLKRRILAAQKQEAPRQPGQSSPRPQPGGDIEGEYTVIQGEPDDVRNTRER